MKALLTRNHLFFVVLCGIWGTTWWATKLGLATVPPFTFAATRFLAAGAVLLGVGITILRQPLPAWRSAPKLVLSSLLLITLCYGPLFWGMQYVPSGLAAVIEMSLTPVALLLFAVLLRQENLSISKILALALGLTGVGLLFIPRLLVEPTGQGLLSVPLIGIAAVAVSAFSYAAGSVLARPVLETYSTVVVSGLTLVIGGAALLLAALAFEPGAIKALTFQWEGSAWLGWTYLVLLGSLVAFALYMQLLRDIGASRSGNYAFISPVIAVMVGAISFGERIEPVGWFGMVVLFAAAFTSLHADTRPARNRKA